MIDLDKFRAEHRHITSYFPFDRHVLELRCFKCEITQVFSLYSINDNDQEQLERWLLQHKHEEDLSYVEMASK